ncbi:MAG: chitobiase/beta-hexosaminidase C-terminal domain-containing protein [Treponema sp.]|nr:chitobiase/beta-hexosaminidase C-terminal domain-containing protein [Treponema sp.]
MKNILNKVAGLALVAGLVFGMFGCANGTTDSIIKTVETPVFIVASGTVTSGTSVTISCATEGAKIYYTTDGSEPTASSTEYTTAISITADVTIKAIAIKSGMNDSAVVTASYTIKATKPRFSVASGTVTRGTSVTISCATEGAKIYYTTDGSNPTSSSTEYTGAISVTAAVTLKAIAVKDGMNDSTVASVSYTISSFVKVKGTTITGKESWTPSSSVFVRGRSITIPDMYVCDHEVTRGEFKELMGTDPSEASAYDKDGNKLTGDAVLNNPVNYVNWYAAIAYCNKLSLKENLTPCYSVSGVTDWENLAYSSIPTSSNSTWNALTYDKEADGYRLPTEAEWEWLARGGENYTYAGSNTVDDVAWYTTNTNDTGSREVKTKQANGYGLYDMSGNVWEWCYDWYTDTVSSSTADTGASSGSYRVQRGGSMKRMSVSEVRKARPERSEGNAQRLMLLGIKGSLVRNLSVKCFNAVDFYNFFFCGQKNIH